MKIVQITPGILPIPPNGWGAVEKIIWEWHNCFIKFGFDSEIKYLNDLDGSEDIVHIHTANLANEAHRRGIRYYYTFHDHHAYLYGKESENYKENFLAIKNAIKAFVPAKYLVEYFNNIPEYFSHGVSEVFITDNLPKRNISTLYPKLLCVGNNGYSHDKSYDRKGFSFAIKAAMKLNTSITIVGPENNMNFFNANPQLRDYDKLTIKGNLNDEELIKEYKEHDIFLHPSELEAGHPNLTLLEAMGSGLPIVGCYEDTPLEGMWRVNRDENEIARAIEGISESYMVFSSNAYNQAKKLTWMKRVEELIKIYKQANTMKETLIREYNNLERIKIDNIIKKSPNVTIKYHFVDGGFCEILSNVPGVYRVIFTDMDTGNIVHQTIIKNNHWTRTSRKYFTRYKIEVIDTERNERIFEHTYNAEGARVYISLNSSSIGDTLAWFPYLEEFRKKHKCHLITSTHHNDWFESVYPDIEFVRPGSNVENIYAMYQVGWYNDGDNVDYNRNPLNYREIPLQQAASSILGLNHKEIKPKLSFRRYDDRLSDKYVCIAPHATAQAKYWNYPNGWQVIIDYLNMKGYKVVVLSKEKLDSFDDNLKLRGKLNNVIDFTGDKPIEERAGTIMEAELFIGLGSGLSWLSWALGQNTILISGFSDPYMEFSDCERISAQDNVCHGCFGKYKFNPGEWDWCPVYKGNQDKIFECSKSITPYMVIERINKLLNIEN